MYVKCLPSSLHGETVKLKFTYYTCSFTAIQGCSGRQVALEPSSADGLQGGSKLRPVLIWFEGEAPGAQTPFPGAWLQAFPKISQWRAEAMQPPLSPPLVSSRPESTRKTGDSGSLILQQSLVLWLTSVRCGRTTISGSHLSHQFSWKPESGTFQWMFKWLEVGEARARRLDPWWAEWGVEGQIHLDC